MNREFGRTLHLNERFSVARTISKAYNNFSITGTYSQNLTKNLPILFNALRKTFLDDYVLVCNVFDENGSGLRFYPLQRLRFGDILSFWDSSYLENNIITERYCKTVRKIAFEVKVQKPLFQLQIVGDNNLTAIFEHTIADGVSAANFHGKLLENIGYVIDESNNTELKERYGIQDLEEVNLDSIIFDFEKDKRYIHSELPLTVDGVMGDLDSDYTDGDPCYFDKMIPAVTPNKWPGRFPVSRDRSIAYKLINCTPEETQMILRKCREKGVSLTAYFEVIEMLALRPIIGNGHYVTHKVAVNSKRHIYAKHMPEELTNDSYKGKLLGTHAYHGIAHNLPPLSDFSWPLAKQLTEYLKITIKNTKLQSAMRGFKIAEDKNETSLLFDKVGTIKEEGVKISNLGFCKFNIYGKKGSEWTITNMIFFQDIAAHACEFAFSIISTSIGGLNIIMSYFDDQFHDHEHAIFADLPNQFKLNLIKYSQKD